MKEFTVEEILEFSRNIEMESYTYYTTAAQRFDDSALKELATDLAGQELEHYNKFNKILEDYKLSRAELDARIAIPREDHDRLVEARVLPDYPTPRMVLEAAYEREVHTGGLYRTMITLTNLPDDIVRTFSELMDQEQGHANRIQSLMRKYR